MPDSKTDQPKNETTTVQVQSDPAADASKASKTPANPSAKKDDSTGGTRYLNTTSTPLVYDRQGHQVDAAGWTPEITLDAVGKAARKAGHLLPPSAL